MKDIAIYGAGGFGKEVACLIDRINTNNRVWNLIGFFDDNDDIQGTQISHFGTCIGGMYELNSYPDQLNLVVAIGDSSKTRSVVQRINNENIVFPNLISPDFQVTDIPTFKIGNGNIIMGGCVVTCDVTIGDFNVLDGSVVIGHDDVIGSFNTFMPGARISGGVTIGNGNFFGVGSIVLQTLKVGNNVRVGAGSVLMTRPKDGGLYIGNPASRFRFL